LPHEKDKRAETCDTVNRIPDTPLMFEEVMKAVPKVKPPEKETVRFDRHKKG
jgi:hypothetical protein